MGGAFQNQFRHLKSAKRRNLGEEGAMVSSSIQHHHGNINIMSGTATKFYDGNSVENELNNEN